MNERSRILAPLPNDLARRSFFNTSIADIYRAIDGGALTGAFTLLFCSMDAMAYLYDIEINPNSKPQPQGSIFRKWITKWLKKQSRYVDRQFLWELRCALVHAHGGRIANPFRYSLTHEHPELHWYGLFPNSPKSPHWYMLNLESLLAEYTLASKRCFDDLEPNWATDPSKQILQLNRLLALTNQEELVPPPGRFADMQRALAPLDELNEPSLNDIVETIQGLYI